MKSTLHNTIAEGIYSEISQQQSRYYYFLGKTLTWENDSEPPFPTDSFKYELSSRADIITMKQIKPTDVSFVVPRIDWTAGTVYDSYDDDYCEEVIGVDLISGGANYTVTPKIYIGSTGSVSWASSTAYTVGDMVSTAGRYYMVTVEGVSGATAPSHTSGTSTNGTCTFKYVNVEDGGGTGATATCSLYAGKVIEVTMTNRGSGYLTPPTVTIADNNGDSAYAESVIGISATGKSRMEDCLFYVITEDNNVYVCLNNNDGGVSTEVPKGTSSSPITYSDGYVWKFLYSIPISLRNKFLTESYIPVSTALKNQFYSGGTIQAVRIDNGGSGYTGASISVQGDGYLAENPLFITDIGIDTEGSGYTYANVEIAPPISGAVVWNDETAVISGQYLSYNNNIYRVEISGTTGVSAPTHRYGIASNGTSALKFVGSTAYATATVSAGKVTDITLYGSLRRIDMVAFGSGYITAPEVTISGGEGTGATAVAVLQNGSVISLEILDPGVDYTEAPTITIGTEWTANTALSANDQVFVSNRLYTVTVAGTTGSTAPTHVSGSETDGTATLTYAGEAATAICLIKFGAGYSTTPSITITGDGTLATASSSTVKSEARIVPIISNSTMGSLWTPTTSYVLGQNVWYGSNLYQVIVAGTSGSTAPIHSSGIATSGSVVLRYSSTFGSIIGARILDGGVGYSYANVSLNGDGDDAQVSIDLSIGNIDTQQANIELLTIDGSISSIPLISGGYGYTSAIVSIVGDGSGATGQAVIDPETGRITKINVTNVGSGYRWAYVTINGNPDAYGASARVIISPYGGMGKDAINNLYTRTLMFYTNISNDKNQGFAINNDYRQIGVIKAPRKYGAASALVDNLASACWVVSAVTDVETFPADTLLNMVGDNSPRFRIVANTGTSILLQSIDNATPITNSEFNKADSLIPYSFTATSVTPPTVDKYSGDLLYIDNRQAFTPTQDQAVTMRTVIRF